MQLVNFLFFGDQFVLMDFRSDHLNNEVTIFSIFFAMDLEVTYFVIIPASHDHLKTLVD